MSNNKNNNNKQISERHSTVKSVIYMVFSDKTQLDYYYILYSYFFLNKKKILYFSNIVL